MSFEYVWKNNEANFGPPVEKQVRGGAHVTVEIILKKDGKYVALRRPSIPGHESPGKNKLYFCHNLIRYGESVEGCVKRIVREQAGVSVKSFRIVDMESVVHEDQENWAIVPYVIAELDRVPQPGNYGNEVTEVVIFDKNDVPDEFGWWTAAEVKEFLEEHD